VHARTRSAMTPLEIFLFACLLVAFVGMHMLERVHTRRALRRGHHIACFGCIQLVPPSSRVTPGVPQENARAEAKAIAAIDALPCAPWPSQASSSSSGDDGSCSLCLEAFQVGVPVTQLPSCGHLFHHACVTRWLKSRPGETRRCPLCNADPLACLAAPSPEGGNTSADDERRGAAATHTTTCPSAAAAAAAEETAGAAGVAGAAEAAAAEVAGVAPPPATSTAPAAAASAWAFGEWWFSPGGTRYPARGTTDDALTAVSPQPLAQLAA
jgi:hypothetical protein